MKFGKLADISGVDFTHPADDPRNGALLNQHKSDEPARIFIGGTGWSNKDFVGTLYPPKTKSTDFLKYYSRQYNTIELNTTHYRIPSPEMVEKWRTDSAPDFQFCPKVLQRISHSSDLGIGSGLLPAFCEAIAGLEEKLGCCFIQMSPYFDTSRLGKLKYFIERWPRQLPLAVELRHESWYRSPALLDEAHDYLQSQNVATVITDVAGRRDVLHQRLTSPIAMIRFVGNALDTTDYQRLDVWVERVSTWIAQGLRELYFFPHQADDVVAVETGIYFGEQLQKAAPVEIRLPELTRDTQSDQMSLF